MRVRFSWLDCTHFVAFREKGKKHTFISKNDFYHLLTMTSYLVTAFHQPCVKMSIRDIPTAAGANEKSSCNRKIPEKPNGSED